MTDTLPKHFSPLSWQTRSVSHARTQPCLVRSVVSGVWLEALYRVFVSHYLCVSLQFNSKCSKHCWVSYHGVGVMWARNIPHPTSHTYEHAPPPTTTTTTTQQTHTTHPKQTTTTNKNKNEQQQQQHTRNSNTPNKPGNKQTKIKKQQYSKRKGGGAEDEGRRHIKCCPLQQYKCKKLWLSDKTLGW